MTNYIVICIHKDSSLSKDTFDHSSSDKVEKHVTTFNTTDPPSKEEILSNATTDIIVRLQADYERLPRLVIFDMDSTLINQECIDLLAAEAGVEKEVSTITKRAMEGELDFKESLAARVALLRGLDVDVFERVKQQITLADGALQLCRALKALHIKTAVISGGFVPLARHVQNLLGIDYMYSNTLSSHEDKLTGVTEGVIVDAERKRTLLFELAKRFEIDVRDVAAMGDGANDIPMLQAAGFGVAIHAKAKVQQIAPHRIRFGDLTSLLYCYGLDHLRIADLAS